MSVSPKTRRRGSHTSARCEAEETTPLLAGGPLSSANVVAATSASSHGSGPAPPLPPSPAAAAAAADDDDKPLPKRQIFLLCYARTMEPIAFFSIFPYIAAMVQRNGRLPPSDVGFYSGLIESLFSLAQMAVLIVWGRLADRLGRKRVLVWSLAGMAAGPLLFGLATTLPRMMAARCLAGVFSGSALIIRTMLSDHCAAPRAQARAFSWFAFAGNVGIFLGPAIGGALADPAAQYPALFGRGWPFLERYPYAAPGFAVSALAATGVVTSVLFLDETLQYNDAHNSNNKTRGQADGGGGGGGGGGDKAERLTIWQLLRTRGIPTVLLVNGSVMVMAFAFTALLPVVLFTPVALGGLGLSPFQISAYMAVQGLSQAVWLVGVFPRLHRRLGNKRLLTACAAAYPFFFLTYVALCELLRVGTPAARAWAWVVGPLAAVVGPGVSMAFTGVQLALNDAAPDPHVMGTLNGIALTLASALRSFVPGLTTALYAVGVREQILRGHLAWVVLIPVSMLMLIVIPRLPNDKQPVSHANLNDEAEL
ncbi:hypothetical protein ARSEF4850_002708 [Beauveria asiatica]